MSKNKNNKGGKELADQALDDPSSHKSIEEQLEGLTTEDNGKFYDFQGQPIPW